MRKTILILAVVFAAGLLFVNVYTSVVDARNWGHDVPSSLTAARQYFSVANPGAFFRVASPASQIIALIALIACWKVGVRVRIYCASALVLAVLCDVFTFAYFYPRNEIMFIAPLGDTESLKTVWSQWSSMNWLRSGILAAQLILDYLALMLVSGTSR